MSPYDALLIGVRVFAIIGMLVFALLVDSTVARVLGLVAVALLLFEFVRMERRKRASRP